MKASYILAAAVISVLGLAMLATVGSLPKEAAAASSQKFCISGLSNGASFDWMIEDNLSFTLAGPTSIPGFQSLGPEFLDDSKFADLFVTSINNPPTFRAFKSGQGFDPCFRVYWADGAAFKFFVKTPQGAWCNVSTAGAAGCSFNPTITLQDEVGGIAELPDQVQFQLETPSSGSGHIPYIAAAAAAGALLLITIGTWCLRRRLLRA